MSLHYFRSCCYENALHELLRKKQAGEKIRAPEQRQPANVVNLMDALRKSVEAERGGSAAIRSPLLVHGGAILRPKQQSRNAHDARAKTNPTPPTDTAR
jgi:DNA end-binding protein Ku